MRRSGLLAGVTATLSALATAAAAQSAQPAQPPVALACSSGMDCVIRQFKDTPEASVLRGRIVFQNYCVLCHGREGMGDGRAARLHMPPPANLVASRVPAEYLNLIIRRGGEAIGRGKGMPPWNEQLTDEQTRDVVAYLLTIRH